MPRKSTRKAVARRKPTEAEAGFDELLADAEMSEVQRLSAAHTEDAVRSLVEIATATERELFPNKDGYFPVLMEKYEDDDGKICEEPIRKPYQPGPRASAAKALLEHAHGRPNQRLPANGAGSEFGITVVLQTYTASGESKVIDVTPTPERIRGADPPSERVDT